MIGIGSEAHLSDQMLSKRSFAILASLTSNWLPSIGGKLQNLIFTFFVGFFQKCLINREKSC